MTRAELNRLQFTVALVSEFAKTFTLGKREAFNYLRDFKGLEFLGSHYDYMHTQSFDDVIEDLSAVCNRNGGALS